MNIFSTKKEIKVKQNARVFISRNENIAIIATMHYNGKGGFLYEDEKPVVMSSPIEPENLGQITLNALRATRIKILNINTMRKKSDWPAFKISKVKSMRKFEQDFICMHIRAANEMNLIYQIDGDPYVGSELHVSASISSAAKPENIGVCLLTVFRACLDRRI